MDEQTQVTRQELAELHDKFREMKHAINNTLAVVMALSELAQRNTQHYEKLAKTVLTRCPDIVAELQEFSKSFVEKIKPPAAAGVIPIAGVAARPAAPTPSSGL